MQYSKELGNLTGVYQIRNILNNDKYIGSASIKFSLRKNHHSRRLEKGKHCNIHLQRAVEKYGIENFVFEILELCNTDECEIREQHYINTFKPHYNISVFVGKGRKGLKATQRMKDVASKTHKGKIVTENTRKRMSEARIGISNPLNKGQKPIEQMERLWESTRGRIQTEEEKNQRSNSCKEYHRNNPKLSVAKMKELIILRSENKSLKFLMKYFGISQFILENILYKKEYREFHNIEDCYKQHINYKQIRNNQYKQ